MMVGSNLFNGGHGQTSVADQIIPLIIVTHKIGMLAPSSAANSYCLPCLATRSSIHRRRQNGPPPIPSPVSRCTAGASNLIAGGGSESQTSEDPDRDNPLGYMNSVDLPRSAKYNLRTFSLTLRMPS